jgi:asparagine synthetase B (glutamine-hydrolysing)
MGGDELTYGYGKHHQLYRRRELYGLPRRVRTFAGAGVRMLGGIAPNKLQAARMAYFVDDWERYLALKNYPAIDGLREVPSFARFSRDAFSDLAEPLYLSVPRYELTDALPNDQLIVYDHASMRASLELRTPFLSTRLAAVVAEFDPRALLAFGQKSVLRRLLARYLPTSLFDYPKSGFRFPHDVFLSRHGSHTPKMPGLPTPVAESLWQQRGKGGGWARLGVRLVAASAFAARYKAA